MVIEIYGIKGYKIGLNCVKIGFKNETVLMQFFARKARDKLTCLHVNLATPANPRRILGCGVEETNESFIYHNCM